MDKYLYKYQLQQELENYLNIVTNKSRYKNQYICPICGSGRGIHHTGALSITTDRNGIPRATCFVCHELYNSDIFEAIGKIENISGFPAQYNKAAEMFGYEFETINNSVNSSDPKNSLSNPPIKEKEESKLEDFNEFIRVAHENVTATDYWVSRLISENIVEQFSLGYAEGWKHPSSPNMKPKKGIIIPISRYSYVFRDIETANSDYRYFKIKSRNTAEDKYLNFKALTESTSPIWITEGEIDALTILSGGKPAVSLGSIANIKDFAESCKDLDIKAPLIIFLDNDEKGQKAAQELRQEFFKMNEYRRKRGLKSIPHNTNDYYTLSEVIVNEKDKKDPNEVAKTLGKIKKHLWKLYLFKYTKFIEDTVKEAMEQKTDSSNYANAPVQHDLLINKYIAECKECVLNMLRNNKKTLLVSPMGTGKTQLIQDINGDVANAVTVIVNPSVAQLKQIEKTYNIAAVYGGLTYNNESIVCVTPESLMSKVIARLQHPFILVVDEAHEKYTSYNFRRAFGDIAIAEKMALYTVYMTATPDILLEDGIEQFDAIVTIHRKNCIEQKTKILEAENCSIEQKTALIKESLKKADLVVLHNDNKKENEVICDTLNKKLHIKTAIDKYFQQNLFGVEPQYITSEKDTTISLDASKRDTKAFVELTNTSKIDKDVRLFCTTSCVQAGLNINNDRSTIVIYACNKQNFKSVNFLQSIGRYRNKENVVEIDLLKSKLDKTIVSFKNFSTIYEEEAKLAKDLEKVVNHYYKITKDKEDAINLAKAGGLIFNDKQNCFEIDYSFTKAKAQGRYNKSLLYHPEILKRKLEEDEATNLKIEIEDYKPQPEKETKEKLKEKKEEIKLIFQSATKEMSNYNDEQLQQVLDYTIDQRKKENQKVVEVMKNYHETATNGFVKLLKETAELKNVSKAEAFRYMMQFETLQEVKDKLSEIKVIATNKLINQIGIDTIYADSLKVARGLPPEHKKVALIRYVLKDAEKKQGRISKELKQKIIDKAIEIKLYKIKNPSDIEKVGQDIERYINMIYIFKNDKNNKRISCIKMQR